MGFAERIRIAERFEREVECYLHGREAVQSVAKNGTEHTHPDFVALLRSNGSPGSKFVRFAPDGVFLQANGRVVHWEAKSGKSMERDAYQTYMAYHDMGCQVAVFIRHPSSEVFWQFVEMIGFIPSDMVVSQFPPSRRHPIDEDDWICPRSGHGYAGRGSGTPYREIDFGSLNKIEGFYQSIKSRLPAA